MLFPFGIVCAAVEGGGTRLLAGLAQGSAVGSPPKESCRIFCCFEGEVLGGSGAGILCC